jgi:hypothetical protein
MLANPITEDMVNAAQQAWCLHFPDLVTPQTERG